MRSSLVTSTVYVPGCSRSQPTVTVAYGSAAVTVAAARARICGGHPVAGHVRREPGALQYPGTAAPGFRYAELTMAARRLVQCDVHLGQ